MPLIFECLKWSQVLIVLMKYKNNFPVLGYGAMRLPDNFAEAEELVLRAIEKGVDYFDVAYIYRGKETLLGKIVSKNNLRSKIKIATKLPQFLCRSSVDFSSFFSKQLTRLQTDYIDYYMLHMLNNPAELSDLFAIGLGEWIAQKKMSGEIRQLGFSFHGNTSHFTQLIDAYEWDFCMIQYNYLDTNNQAGTAGLRYAHSKGIPVIIMEPLRGGLLANPKRIPPKAAKLFSEFSVVPPVEWALRWLWNHEEVSCVLSGMQSFTELDGNIAIADSSYPGCLTAEESELIEQVTAIFRESIAFPCTGCNYCMPCPVGVNIPGCFTAYNDKSRNSYIKNTGALVSAKGVASGCVKCGKCEPRCPQSIAIQESLEIVCKKMEPLWFRAAAPIVRKFMKKKTP